MKRLLNVVFIGLFCMSISTIAIAGSILDMYERVYPTWQDPHYFTYLGDGVYSENVAYNWANGIQLWGNNYATFKVDIPFPGTYGFEFRGVYTDNDASQYSTVRKMFGDIDNGKYSFEFPDTNWGAWLWYTFRFDEDSTIDDGSVPVRVLGTNDVVQLWGLRTYVVGDYFQFISARNPDGSRGNDMQYHDGRYYYPNGQQRTDNADTWNFGPWGLGFYGGSGYATFNMYTADMFNNVPGTYALWFGGVVTTSGRVLHLEVDNGQSFVFPDHGGWVWGPADYFILNLSKDDLADGAIQIKLWGSGDVTYVYRTLLTLVEELDSDGDGIGDTSDNCPLVANTDQADCDFNGIGDVCEESNITVLCDTLGDIIDAQVSQSGSYKNHGQYVSQVAHLADVLVAGECHLTNRDTDGDGISDADELHSCLVSTRAKLDVGKRK